MYTTSDKRVVTPQDIIRRFGTVSPKANENIVNTINIRQVNTATLRCETAFIKDLKGSFDPGDISFKDGSASAPSISFTNASSTGIYRRQDGGVGVSVGGSEVANFSDGLNVGKISFNGNLVLNPTGGVDFSGRPLLNVGDVSIKVGEPDEVIVNDSDGNMTSEPYLSTSRGGTGIDSSTATGIPRITAGAWSVGLVQSGDIDPAANLVISSLTAPNINTVSVAADNITASGTVAANSLNISGAASVGSLAASSAVSAAEISASSLSAFEIKQNASSGPISPSSDYESHVRAASTVGPPVLIATINTSPTKRYLITLWLSFGNGADSGMISVIFKCKNVGGTVSAGAFVQEVSAIDAALEGAAVSTGVNGNSVEIYVGGVTAEWVGRVEILTA
mgnify:CR=1 FL=1